MKKQHKAFILGVCLTAVLSFTGCSSEPVPNPYNSSDYVVKTHFGILCEMIDANEPISKTDVALYQKLAENVKGSENPDKEKYYEAFKNLAETLEDLEGELLPAGLVDEGSQTCDTVS